MGSGWSQCPWNPLPARSDHHHQPLDGSMFTEFRPKFREYRNIQHSTSNHDWGKCSTRLPLIWLYLFSIFLIKFNTWYCLFVYLPFVFVFVSACICIFAWICIWPRSALASSNHLHLFILVLFVFLLYLYLFLLVFSWICIWPRSALASANHHSQGRTSHQSATIHFTKPSKAPSMKAGKCKYKYKKYEHKYKYNTVRDHAFHKTLKSNREKWTN